MIYPNINGRHMTEEEKQFLPLPSEVKRKDALRKANAAATRVKRRLNNITE